MISEHTKRIYSKMLDFISQFQNGAISYEELSYFLLGSVNAIENPCVDLIKSVRQLCGELEIIHHTVDLCKEKNIMQEKINVFIDRMHHNINQDR